MAFNFSSKPVSLVPDSPAVKRQRTTNGYSNSTNNSASNTNAYNSDADDGDDLFEGYIPDTPANGRYETQPTQILDRSTQPFSSPSAARNSTVQVPASSPLRGKDNDSPKHIQNNAPKHFQAVPQRPNLAMSMAPAGTAYKPPYGIKTKPFPTKNYITIDDDDDGPTFQGGSSDDDIPNSANIKPTTFASKSAHSSFGPSPHFGSSAANGNAKFQSIVSNAAYKAPEKGKMYGGSVYDIKNRHATATSSSVGPKATFSADSMSMGYGSSKKPSIQAKPERASPVQDINLDSVSDPNLRDKITRLRMIYPNLSVLSAQNALLTCRGSMDDAAVLIGSSGPIVIPDEDEMESSGPTKKLEPQMKRGLNAPIVSIKDRYASTQVQAPKQATQATPPPKPKRKLIQGRRNPSSPSIPHFSSPLKPAVASPAASLNEFYDSDSGVATESEEDPELEARVLKYLNTCKVQDLVELTNTTTANAELMIAARPFRSLDVARNVANPAPLKGGKKSTRAPIGEKIVETAENMFIGYEAIDALVTRCEELGKPLAEEMAKWGFDVFGAAKDGELEMTSFEDDSTSQRDSGIGSPSSGAVSVNGDAVDDEVRVVTTTRKRGTANYLKKPDIMAEDCVLKDYQVVGLNWLALMYRNKLSGILADEMGLGKTCQVIALLSHLVETGNNGPHLVVCPGSTLENWLREFPKFAPKLVVEPYYGTFSAYLSITI